MQSHFRFLLIATMIALAGCSGGAGAGTSGTASLTPKNLQAAAGESQNGGNYAAVVRADAPVSYFRLDDGKQNVAVDSGSQALNGSYNGALESAAPSLLNADADFAVNFLGGNVKVGNNKAVQPTAALSVEAWILPTSAATNAQLVKIVSNSQSWSVPYEAYLLGLQNGQPTFRILIGGIPVTATATTALTPDTRHHLVGTYDGSAVRIWIDGRLGAVVIANGQISNYTTDGWAIGSDVAGQWVFRGSIDEVAIYSHALTLNRVLIHEAAAGVGAAYTASVLAANPVGYYRLGETTGTVAYDASPTNASGSYGSGVAQNGAGLLAASDPATNFTNGIISILRSPAQFPLTAVTVEAIAKPSAASLFAQEVKVVAAGTPWSAPYESYKLSLDNGHPGMGIATDQGSFQVIADTALAADQVAHLAGSYDGNTLAVYLNGQLLKSVKASGALYPSTGSGVGIGGDVTANWLYRGELSDVAIYPTALSSEVLQAHAALVSGAGGKNIPQPQIDPTPATLHITPPLPSATPSALQLSQASVNLLSMADSAKVTASEPGYSGPFTVASDTCSSVATIQGNNATFTVLPLGAGVCRAQIQDVNGQSTTLSIAITLTSILGE